MSDPDADDELDEVEDDGDPAASSLGPPSWNPFVAALELLYAARVRRRIKALGIDARPLDAFVLDGLVEFQRGSRGLRTPSETAIQFLAAFASYFTDDPLLPDRLRGAAIAWRDAGTIRAEVAEAVLERLAP